MRFHLSAFSWADPAHGSRVERRHAVRFPCGMRTWGRVHHSGAGGPEAVTIRSLSSGGVSLGSRRRLEPGTVVLLELSHSIRLADCQVAVRVLRVHEYPDGNFVLEGAFTRQLGDAELQELL